MKVFFPNSAFLGNIDPFLRSLDMSNPDILDISFNPKWVSVHPVILSMITVLGLSIENKENLFVETPEAKSKNYFERIGFFELIGYDSGIEINKHESAGKFVPLTLIKKSEELHDFITEMIPLLHREPNAVEPIKYVVSELVRNVFEHSQSDIGAVVCAQYYRKSNTIRIGVADSGIGLKSALEKSHHVNDDMHAIKLALTPGITGKTHRIGGTDFNAGAGLFFIRSLAKVNKDFFFIYSGDSMYKLLKNNSGKGKMILHGNPFEENHNKTSGLPFWDGTAVGIDICLNRHKKFDAVLSLIRQAYSKQIREKKKSTYKKAQFI